MSNLMNDYVLKIFDTYQMEPAQYPTSHFNDAVASIPFGELHTLDTRQTVLPRLGEDLPLNQHIQQSFMKAIGEGDLEEMVRPVRIHGSKLKDIDRWDEWNTLISYMEANKLRPYIVFRNEPDYQGYYVADIRMRILFSGSFDLT